MPQLAQLRLCRMIFIEGCAPRYGQVEAGRRLEETEPPLDCAASASALGNLRGSCRKRGLIGTHRRWTVEAESALPLRLTGVSYLPSATVADGNPGRGKILFRPTRSARRQAGRVEQCWVVAFSPAHLEKHAYLARPPKKGRYRIGGVPCRKGVGEILTRDPAVPMPRATATL